MVLTHFCDPARTFHLFGICDRDVRLGGWNAIFFPAYASWLAEHTA